MFPNHQARLATQALIESGQYIQIEHDNVCYGIHHDYYQQYLLHQTSKNPCSKQYSGSLTETLGVPAVAIIAM